MIKLILTKEMIGEYYISNAQNSEKLGIITRMLFESNDSEFGIWLKYLVYIIYFNNLSCETEDWMVEFAISDAKNYINSMSYKDKVEKWLKKCIQVKCTT